MVPLTVLVLVLVADNPLGVEVGFGLEDAGAVDGRLIAFHPHIEVVDHGAVNDFRQRDLRGFFRKRGRLGHFRRIVSGDAFKGLRERRHFAIDIAGRLFLLIGLQRLGIKIVFGRSGATPICQQGQ